MKTFTIPQDTFSNKEKVMNESERENMFKQFKYVLIILLTLTVNIKVMAQDFPAGFSQQLFVSGLNSPTIMKFSPDGRLFVAEKTGALRIVKNGVLLSQPFITLSVDAGGERGLLGIAFDPSFSTNHYIYLYYTLSNGANNRISRFTANGDVVVAGSEMVLLNLDPLGSDQNHNGGTIKFGQDGKLYIGTGDNHNGANSQNLNTNLGKVLRINSNGTIPSGNPFTTGSTQMRSVWAYGFRNPYTLTFQPGTNKLFVNDVGENAWEEINNATTGGLNFGWPNAEGNSTNTAYTNPVYAYGHGTGSGLGCAITGGTFYYPNTTNYPTTYTGNYFYIDYCGNWIDRLVFSGSTVTRFNFASNISGNPVGIIVGPAGNLYYISRATNSVYKITFNGPAITTLSPVADTYVRGGPYTNSNFGSEIRMYSRKAGATSEGLHECYIRFNISNITLPITNAKLRLYGSLVIAGAATQNVNVYRVGNQTWQENTITYSNKPNADATALDSKPVSDVLKYYEWDVTQLIIDAKNAGNTFISLNIKNKKAGTNSKIKFYTKEIAGTNKPRLEITSTPGAVARTENSFSPSDVTENKIEIKLYPNPAHDYINLDLLTPLAAEIIQLQIYSLDGKLVKSFQINNNETQQIPLEGLMKGTYLLNLSCSDGIISERVTIE